MASASPIAASPPRVAGSRPLAAALAAIVLVTTLRLTGTVDSDVSWQLWIAGRVHAGARLYRDIIEVNPPLWFWMALPVDRLASFLHLRVEGLLIAAMGSLAALSLFATDRLLPALGGPRRALLLAYAALVLTAMPWMQVGQREQLVLFGTLPYAALIAARRDGRAVAPLLAVLIGAGAALGFALKHYFLVVPVLLELWLVAARSQRWRLLRPETIALVAVGTAYAGAILLWAREYLTDVLPLVRLAYGVTGAPHFTDLVQPGVVAGMAMLSLAAMARRSLNSTAAAMLVAATGFLVAYALQAKGWAYHALPLLGCSSIGLAAGLAYASRPSRTLVVAAPALLLMPFAIAARGALTEPLPGDDLTEAVSGLRAGDSVGFIATDPALAWSITLQQGLRYPSRYMGFWMMRAVVRNEELGRPDPRLTALGRSVVAQTVADFRCVPPRRIIVARPRPGEDGFDILPFFLRDRQFADLLSHYHATSRTTVETYERMSALGPAASCRPGV